MTVDRQGRDRLRNALLGYLQEKISNEVLTYAVGDYAFDDIPDKTLSSIAYATYTLYDDLHEHLISTRRGKPVEVSEELRNIIMRMQAFLRTDEILPDDLLFTNTMKRKQAEQFSDKHKNYWPFSSMEEVARRRDEIADLSPEFQDSFLAEYLAHQKEIRKFGITDYVLLTMAVVASVLMLLSLFFLWISS
jgi:hypothetical protein